MKASITLKTVYKEHYKKLYKKKSLKLNVFSFIVKNFNKRIVDKIVDDAYDFVLPYKLGKLRIRKVKLDFKLDSTGKIDRNHKKIDWYKTWILRFRKYPGKTKKEINELLKDTPIKDRPVVLFYNEHTAQYYAKWYWDKTTATVPNISVYNFVPTRMNRVRLARKILNNNEAMDMYSEFMLYKKSKQ